MTITFASIQMVEQNVEETDTSKIITKISCELIMSDRACSDECAFCKKTEFTLDISC